MSAPVSVVVPTLGAAETIGPCLEALTEGVVAGLVRELVIADGGSTDAIAAVADAVGAGLVVTPPGRGGQLAAGAAAARGSWLLFVHADTVLAPGWPAAVRRHMRAHPGCAGWFPLAFDADGLAPCLVAAWANLRASALGLPFGDQGLLVPAALYRQSGGHPALPLMEDVAIARALGRRRLRRLGGRAVTSAERYRRDGWARRGWRNLTTQALFLAGVPAGRLVRRYRGRG